MFPKIQSIRPDVKSCVVHAHSPDSEGPAPRRNVLAKKLSGALEGTEPAAEERRVSINSKLPPTPSAPTAVPASATSAKVTWEQVEDPNKVIYWCSWQPVHGLIAWLGIGPHTIPALISDIDQAKRRHAT